MGRRSRMASPTGMGNSLRVSSPSEEGLPFDLEGFLGEFFGGEQSFGEGLPFDLEGFLGELFGGEQSFGEGLPFDLEGFLGELFEDTELPDPEYGPPERDDRGFRFRGDGSSDGFCFRLGDSETCGDLGDLSDEEREQLEQMMEMLDGLGLGGFLGGLLDSLNGQESGLSESSTNSSAATGA